MCLHLLTSSALDIDQTRRVLNFNAQIGLGDAEPVRKISNTKWQHGQWIQEISTKNQKPYDDLIRPVPATPFRVLDAPGLRDDFYCSPLAYNNQHKVLAVALKNRVFIWSETGGVRDFERNTQISRGYHITSISFSSSLGGSNILAVGRSNGALTLRAIGDPHERFGVSHNHAVACVSFKPVPSYRRSKFTNTTVAFEDLLAGDEHGNIYYYSVE